MAASEQRNKQKKEWDECKKVVFAQWTNCTILGRHFERVSVPAHVRDKYKILMADRELAFVSGRTRRLFPRVRFHFWPQRRRYTCILFLSCELRRSRSRQNSRARQSTDPGTWLKWPGLRLAALARRIRHGGSTDEGLYKDVVPEDLGEG